MAFPDFHFKRCSIAQEDVTQPVGTDAVLLGAWVNASCARRILDIGTGSGVIALMLAQRTEAVPDVLIEAVEIHPESAACAGRNFAASPWAERLRVWQMPVQEFAQNTPYQFDLIVSNPPFFSETTRSPDETRRLGRHTATLPPVEMLSAVNCLLAPGGRFVVVLPVQEGRRLCELSVPNGLYWTRIMEVRSRREKPVERWLIEFGKDPYPFRANRCLCMRMGFDIQLNIRNLQRIFTFEWRGSIA